MKLSETIYKRRKELGLSQAQVAQELHVTQQTLSNWERGKSEPDIDSLLTLTQLYQLPLDALTKDNARTTAAAKRLKRLDSSLIAVTVVIILMTILIIVLGKQHLLNNHLMGLLMFILIMYLMVGSLWHYHVSNPGPLNIRAPLLIPKEVGFGITINPQNPIGLVIWIALLIGLGVVFMPIIF